MNILVLNDNQILQILNNPEVLSARNRLNKSSKVYFSIELDNDIKTSIKDGIGLDLFSVKDVPMRWIKGDTKPHIDSGVSAFQNTYLIYLHDSQGEFIINNVSYPINRGSGFVFPEKQSHETRNTGTEPRLLIGPMSEFGFSVGGSVTFYYPTEADALSRTNSYTPTGIGSYDINTINGISSWRILPFNPPTYDSFSPSSDPNLVYNTGGPSLIGDQNLLQTYYLYPAFPCFLEGSTILCSVDEKEVYVPIQNLRNGDFVMTAKDGFKKVEMIGTSTISNPGNSERTENRLYICKKENYPELKEDLIITGHHSILVDHLTSIQKEKTVTALGDTYITGNKYRLMAFIDERALPWESEGTYNVWHLALENENIYNNYGIYANGGLLVETTSIRFLRDLSNMKII